MNNDIKMVVLNMLPFYFCLENSYDFLEDIKNPIPESKADKAPTKQAIPISPNIMNPIKMPIIPNIIRSIAITLILFSPFFFLYFN